jgi:hypothetical protein
MSAPNAASGFAISMDLSGELSLTLPFLGLRVQHRVDLQCMGHEPGS